MDVSFSDKFAAGDVAGTSPAVSTGAPRVRGQELFARHLESSDRAAARQAVNPDMADDGATRPTEDVVAGAAEPARDHDTPQRDRDEVQDASGGAAPTAAPTSSAPTDPATPATADEPVDPSPAGAAAEQGPAGHGEAPTTPRPDADHPAPADPQAADAPDQASQPKAPAAGTPAHAASETEASSLGTSDSSDVPSLTSDSPDGPSAPEGENRSHRKTKTERRELPTSPHGAGRPSGNMQSAGATDPQQPSVAQGESPMPQAPVADPGGATTDRASESTGAAPGREPPSPAETNLRSVPLAQRLSDHLFGRGQHVSGHGSEHEGADPSRLVQRVARALETAPRHGGVLRLRLSPPELGSLQLQVTIHKGTLSAKLETETHMARNLLLDQLPQLRHRLEEQGMRVAQFDIDVSQQDAQDSPAQPQPSFDRDVGARRTSSPQEPPAENLPITTRSNVSTPGKLNVVV